MEEKEEEEEEEEVMRRWGTWEELVLGSAVLRHGAPPHWDAVAHELQSHTTHHHPFSPQECEGKFAEIQARYSGCDTWFEELRKERIAELKRELQKSDNSIGSLQSMIESLSNARDNEDNSKCDTSHTESHSPVEYADDTNSSSKELSKDISSAGSFTQEAIKSWSPPLQLNAPASIEVNEKKRPWSGGADIWHWGSRKKRGKRDGQVLMTKESTRDGETLSSDACVERSSEGCLNRCTTSHVKSGGSMGKSTDVDLAAIFKSLSGQEDCSMLQKQLHGQRKRARYKKMIRRHVDFKIIGAKISNGSISSSKELLRDMLLLVSNILVFYPKNTLEHMAALSLRALACKTLQEGAQCPSKRSRKTSIISSPVGKSKKPRITQASRLGAKTSKCSSKNVGKAVVESGEKVARRNVLVGLSSNRRGSPINKRGAGRPPKVDQREGKKTVHESPNKGSKRGRRR